MSMFIYKWCQTLSTSDISDYTSRNFDSSELKELQGYHLISTMALAGANLKCLPSPASSHFRVTLNNNQKEVIHS